MLLIGGVLGVLKMKSSLFGDLKKAPTVTISIPSPAPSEMTPTGVEASEWIELSVMVQNGTAQAGLASKTANIIKEGGITNVESGNADTKDYVSSVLIFKDEILKEKYKERLVNLISVEDKNISVDNLIGYDVVLILGLN
jgi:hypothetical protein